MVNEPPRWFPQYLRPSTQQLVSRGPPDKFSTFIFVSKNLWESDGYESDSDSEDSELDEAAPSQTARQPRLSRVRPLYEDLGDLQFSPGF